MSLSPEQEQAVTRIGQDVCVVAGPGSGKTRVLVARFRWLVEHQNVDPERILAITFTEKAAAELKRRLVGDFSANPTVRRRIERAWVSTIDGFCARLLRENAIAAGIDPQFKILDAAERAEMLREVSTSVLDDALARDPKRIQNLLRRVNNAHALAGELETTLEAVRVAGQRARDLSLPPVETPVLSALRQRLGAFVRSANPGKLNPERLEKYQALIEVLPLLSSERTTANLLPVLSRLDQTLKGLRQNFRGQLPPKDDIQKALGEAAALEFEGERRLLLDLLIQFEDRLEACKREAGLLDFADLEQLACEFLEAHPDDPSLLSNRFDHILLDELQDTNPLQWRLLSLVRSPGAFFAVGDRNQSIYGFRHAEPELFGAYREEILLRGETVDQLHDNYRGRQDLLNAIASITTGMSGLEPYRLLAQSNFLERANPSVELLCARPAKSDADEDANLLEALWVAHRIREIEGSLELSRGGSATTAEYSDMAVLVRSAASMLALQEAFERYGIPYMVAGGKSFFENWEVRDVLRWLRVLENPRDSISLVSVLRSPGVNIGADTLVQLARSKQNPWDSILELTSRPPAGFDLGDHERLLWFREKVQELRRRAGRSGADRLLAQVLDETGVWTGLDARRRANVDKLLGIIGGLSQEGVQPLSTVVRRLSRLRAEAVEAEAAPATATGAVRLMTIHQSKGLEFPVVFVAAIHRRGGQDHDTFSYDPEAGFGVTLRYEGEKIYDPAMRAIRDRRKRREQEETARLFYVAMTRAEEHLTLSWTAPQNGKHKEWADQVSKLVETLDEPGERIAQLADPTAVRVTVADREPPAPAFRLRPPSEPEMILLPPRPMPRSADSSISASAVATFAQCPRRYYLRNYLNLSAEPGANPEAGESTPRAVPALELGAQVHRLLAGVPVPEASPETRQLAARFTASDLGKRAAQASRIDREYGFLFEVESIIVSGQIDLWFEQADERVLVDHKTDRIKPSEAASHADRYRLQVQLYAMALAVGGLPVDQAWLYYLQVDRAVEIDVSPDRLEEAREVVAQVRAAQATRRFPLNVKPHCHRCEFYGKLCPARLSPVGQLSLFPRI